MLSQIKTALRRLLPKNTFAREVSVLIGGTAGAQVLVVLAAPLLTRLYTPEDFGLLAVYAGLLALVGVVASLRYELAIPLPEDDQEAANIVVLSLMIVLVMTLLVSISVIVFGEATAKALGAPALANYLWLFPVGVLSSGTYNVFNYWAVRTKDFSRIAGTRVRQALTTIMIQLAAFKLGGAALLLGQVAGQSVGTTILARPALALTPFKYILWRSVMAAAGRYRRFPIFLTWDGFFNAAGSQLPPLLLAALFGPVAAGLYSLANRILSAPMSLLGGAIGQVFLANAAAAYRAGEHGLLICKLQANLINIGMPPAIILILLGPDIFSIVFGEQWRQAGEFARWMAPWLFFSFVYSPLSTLFAVMERQKQVLFFQIILLITRMAAIGIGAMIGDLLTTIILFSIASAICYFCFLFWVTHMAGNLQRTIWWPMLYALGLAVAGAVPVLICISITDATPVSWGVALSITAALIAARYWQLLRKTY